jgi:hypothetical protein
MPKLQVGSAIVVRGFVMLKGLEDGQKYRVKSMPDYHGNPTYQFTKLRGTKFACRHSTYAVDGLIGSTDLNCIEVL